MAAKAILIICAQVLLVKSAFSQCLGPAYEAGIAGPWGLAGPLAYDGLAFDGYGYGAYGPGCGLGVAASTGGGFPVTSASPIAPTGIAVVSENAIEGALAVGGALPLLGAVALEGAFPTAGAGAVSYGCGNGAVGIMNEAPIATGIVADGLAYGPGLAAGLGYGPGLAAGLPYGPGLPAGLPCGPGLVAGPVYGGCGCGAIY